MKTLSFLNFVSVTNRRVIVRVKWKVIFGFLLPALVGLFLFKFYPIILAAKNSFYTSSFLSGTEKFVGWDNYRSLFSDGIFWNSLKVTLWFNILANPLQVGVAILIAVLVNQKVKGINFFRTIFYLPVAISVPIAAVIWGILLNPNQGFVNSFLSIFGLPAQPFLVDKTQAMFSIILIASWIGFSYWMIFILAALQEIPVELYEAARVDGASKCQMFFRVTLPMLKRSIAFVTVGATTSNFLLFAPTYILTRGGPSGSTHLLMYEAYLSAFSYSDMGRSCAIMMLLLLMILAIVVVEMRMLRESDT
ncbi:MAG TPA: sugar ABC transporter permease [Firmicutes bacterium]|jgi:multiple sugar transport system permease protein|nr:sugar ABC transporter permease [Bacillota bacterium]